MRRHLFCFIALLAFAHIGYCQRPQNLIVIQTDEHNFRTLGCYRQQLPDAQAYIWGKDAVVETPAIDSIAARGAICTSFYATSPVCTPSRASLFTGMYPQNTGSPANDLPLKNEMITFAQVLAEAGYATGYAGKWHLDGPGKPQWAPNRKFGFNDNRYMFNRGHWKMFEITDSGPKVAARKNGKPNYGIDGANEQNFSTDWLTSRAIDFIKKNRGQPFCYHLSLPDPHGPNTVRAPYDSMYTNMAIRPPQTYAMAKQNPKWAPATGRNAAKFRADMMSQYFGMVKCIDDNIQRILDTLIDLNLQETTAIVITADHGDLCYEHGRLNKGNPYEASAMIPMIMVVPGEINEGTVVNEALGTVDFTPTILPLLGQNAPEACEGRDFGKLLRGDSEDWKDVTILRNAGVKAAWMAAVTDRYKLVISLADEPWLFDTKVDPDELQNRYGASDTDEITRFLATELLSYGKEHNDPFLSTPTLNKQIRSILQ